MIIAIIIVVVDDDDEYYFYDYDDWIVGDDTRGAFHFVIRRFCAIENQSPGIYRPHVLMLGKRFPSSLALASTAIVVLGG